METIRFDELELNPKILRGIKDMGFEEATPIQAQGIPAVLSGRDVIGQAQTGTGKTAAFGIPVLESVDASSHKTQVIILSPTRELAIQVADEIRKLAKYMHGVKVLPVYGGQDISRQIKALKGGVQIIIGTPGRLMDHLRRKTIRPDHVKTIVLDEYRCDKMPIRLYPDRLYAEPWYDDNQCTGLFRFCVDTCASRISAGERTSAADQDHSYSKEKTEPETGD